MIRLEAITKIFGTGSANEIKVLKNIDLRVREGDFITIIGSNGAGKSTIFNVIAGTYFPTEGKIFINDKDMTTTPEYKRAKYIGRIFQNPQLGTASNMSIADNMMIAFKKGFKGLTISLNRKMRDFFRTELGLLQMGLEDRIHENVSLLSGGQRQALTLLMMVLSKPALILLDEHTAALDPKNAQLVLDLTVKFINEYGLTAMMVTHNMQHAIQYGNRLLMMDGGEIIFDVQGEEKKNLTVDKIMQKFFTLRHHKLENDKVLLAGNG